MDPLSLAAGWLHEHALLPLLFAVGGMEWEDLAFGWALFACYGVAQVAVTFAVCLPLERWRPVERWPDQKAVWVDVLYTLLSRVGVLPLVTFVLFYLITQPEHAAHAVRGAGAAVGNAFASIMKFFTALAA